MPITNQKKQANEDVSTTLSRLYERHRRIELDHQLAKIRIFYNVFCLAILFAAALRHLKISLAVLMLFVFLVLAYCIIRYFKPTAVSEKKSYPPAIDWLDLLVIAILIYLTGGIRSFFQVVFIIPICGSIIRFGLKTGILGYSVVLCITGLMYFINPDNPPALLSFHIITGMGTLAFIVWLVGIMAEKEWRLRDKMYRSAITDHLSGLYNSSYLRARIREEIDRSNRKKIRSLLYRLSMLIILRV